MLLFLPFIIFKASFSPEMPLGSSLSISCLQWSEFISAGKMLLGVHALFVHFHPASPNTHCHTGTNSNTRGNGHCRRFIPPLLLTSAHPSSASLPFLFPRLTSFSTLSLPCCSARERRVRKRETPRRAQERTREPKREVRVLCRRFGGGEVCSVAE